MTFRRTGPGCAGKSRTQFTYLSTSLISSFADETAEAQKARVTWPRPHSPEEEARPGLGPHRVPGTTLGT